MARHSFGNGLADYTISAGTGNAAVLSGAQVVKFYTASTGGSQYTDLATNSDGTGPITQVTTSDGTDGRAVGTIPPFYGPDGVTGMWAGVGTGPRSLILATDLGAAVTQASADAAAASAAAAAAQAAATSNSAQTAIDQHVQQADPHTQYHTDARGDLRYIRNLMTGVSGLTSPLWKVIFAGQPTNTDSNAYEFWETVSGVQKLGAWGNEKGLPRAECLEGWESAFKAIARGYSGGQTGNLIQLERRNADNSRTTIGGFGPTGLYITSLQGWTVVATVDPGTTGKYTIATTDGFSTLDTLDSLAVRMDTDDVVRMRGQIAVTATGTTNGDVLFNLPAGFAPAKSRTLGAATSGGALVTVQVRSTGAVTARRTVTGPFNLSLDDLTYHR